MNMQLKVKPLTLAFVLALPAMLSTAQVSAIEFNTDNTKFTVGGYLKMMVNYDVNGTVIAPYNGDLYSVYGTPIDGTPNADINDISMTARESRIFLKSSTQNSLGTFNTHLEGDFFADIESDGPTWSNSNGFRIRHAYGEQTFGQHSIVVGQTWSTFMDMAGSMPSMDFAGDPGGTFVRQPQIRYQYNMRGGHYASISAENPTLGLTQAGPNILVNTGSSESLMPDIIAKYFYANKHFTISPRIVVRRFEIDGDSTFGYGAALNGSVKFGDGHKAVLGVMYGDGIGRYAGLGFNAGAGINYDNRIDTLKFRSINGGFIFALRDNLRLAIGTGYSEQDDSGFEDGILTEYANRTAFSWHSHLFWNITSDIEYALGFTSGEAEIMSRDEGDMTRFQTYLKYTF